MLELSSTNGDAGLLSLRLIVKLNGQQIVNHYAYVRKRFFDPHL